MIDTGIAVERGPIRACCVITRPWQRFKGGESGNLDHRPEPPSTQWLAEAMNVDPRSQRNRHWRLAENDEQDNKPAVAPFYDGFIAAYP